MGVFSLRRSLRLALLATLLAAGSAQAGTVCVSGSALCDASRPPATEIVVGLPGREVLPWSVIALEKRNEVRHGDTKLDEWPRDWTTGSATHHVNDWARRRDRDSEEFRRHWHHDRDGHHGDGGCPDDDLPKPVPLPAGALLFGPALLMLRAFQRRNA